MSLHPDIEALIEMNVAALESGARQPIQEMTPEGARADFDASSPLLDIDLPPAPVERGLTIPTRDGAAIAARLYAPAAGSALPGLLHMHSGGFVIGSLDSHVSLCRDLVERSGCAVLSVAYRLAPEHKFPTAFQDAADALAWVGAHGAEIGVDAGRLAIGGDSAGGTLTAALAIEARNRPELPRPHLQILAYPGLSPRQDSASYRRYGTGYLLEAGTVDWFFGHYLRNEADREDWRFAPLAAADLSGVAPALILLAEYDPLVDEGKAYAERLRAAGVPVDLRVYPGMVHEFLRMGTLVNEASEARDAIAAALRRALGLS